MMGIAPIFFWFARFLGPALRREARMADRQGCSRVVPDGTGGFACHGVDSHYSG